jgi:hypothetical protein
VEIARENIIRQLLTSNFREILKMPGEIGKKGDIRQYREDAQIGNVAPDIQKHFGYRSDKTVKAVLEENHVTSIAKLREKIGLK